MPMTLAYALLTLWHERQRYLPGALAVAFSAALVALQGGLLLGLFAFVSLPVDRAAADIWLGAPRTVTVDRGSPIRVQELSCLGAQPEVEWCEPYVQGFAEWAKPPGGTELCMVIGSRLGDGSLGAARDLTPELRARLAEPGAVVVDEADLGRLGLRGVGEHAEVGGRRVRLVGLVRGFTGLAGAYVFCSLETARGLLGLSPDQATYLLARCRDPATAPAVVERLRARPGLSAFTREHLSRDSRVHWLLSTRAGIALGGAALLGLLVGAAVTSQTLYAATAASVRQYAALWALGIPRRRVAGAVIAQSAGVGGAGVVVGLASALPLAQAAQALGARVLLPPWLLGLTAALTIAMAVLSGLFALLALRRMDATRGLR